MFRRYDHVVRLGHEDADGITVGLVHVFPKLDGTNASLWVDSSGLCFGSRNRQIQVEMQGRGDERRLVVLDDNAGFATWCLQDNADGWRMASLFATHPDWVVYGEWLVPHALRTYREDAWRRLWVFDVLDRATGEYLPYSEYSPVLREHGFDVVEPLCTIANPTEEQLRAQVETNTYLVRDGCGLGEGIVVKNYDWARGRDKKGWAKVVRNEFREEAARAHGTTHKEGEWSVEAAIAETYCTPELVGKTRAKIIIEHATEADLVYFDFQRRVEERERRRVIPELLGRVYHDLVTEEVWAFLKEHRDPTVNFKLLRQHCIARVKLFAQDLFA